MAQSSTIITLSQMCDAALNTPEVGIVNFSLLRTLIQVIIKQLNFSDTKVEYRGLDSERIQAFMEKAQPTTHLYTEYSVTGSRDIPESDDDTVILVTSQTSATPQFTVTMTADHIDRMEKSIKKLQSKVKELEDLPGNMKLYEALEKQEGTPILDMFQILNLQKRMDAVDESIEKLASMLEGAAKSQSLQLVRDSPEMDSEVLVDLERRIKQLEDQIGRRGTKITKRSKEALAKQPLKTSSKEVVEKERTSQALTDEEIFTAIKDLEKEVNAIKEVVYGGRGEVALKSPKSPKDDYEIPSYQLTPVADAQPVEIRIKNLEFKNAEFIEQINSLDNGFSRLVNAMQGRLDELEKDMGEILERIHLIPATGDAVETTTNVDAIKRQLNSLEQDFENIIENIKKLTEEKASKEHAIDVLVEQIELLKTIKADREDLEDALADKADACQINRKVSYEQFDQAYGDINRNLEEALNKITQQENLWTQTLMNIQGEVTGKMDKNELTPLREFINNKLKTLQEKFKALSAMKRDQEAAGTKMRFLRNVNCISCDKDVVMRRDIDPSMYPKPYSLPPTKSMGPYLAYELDQLRKQQKCVPSTKNMSVFENALQTSRSAKSPDHVCNRYCGGSHTVTTPQQRVTRLGHFMEQWGPEIAPVIDATVRGTDGKMYKARNDEHLKKLASEKPPSSHGESPTPAIIVSEHASTTKTSLVNHQEPMLSETVDRPVVAEIKPKHGVRISAVEGTYEEFEKNLIEKDPSLKNEVL
ncbi:uncharacterized protein [Diabrotica undecimpunctata]|uniref:uncharacterized protein n=1 Tax=Diabrotica undecimpunctata TaxID=50387 RepID=UPI003B63D3C8